MPRINFDEDLFRENRTNIVTMNDRIDTNTLQDIFNSGVKSIFDTTNNYRRNLKSIFEV